MRFLFYACALLLAPNLYANVVQYFAGISYNNSSELAKTKKCQYILGNTFAYADLKFAGSALNFNTFQYESGVNHSRTVTVMPYGRIAKRLNKKAVVGVDMTQPFNSNLNWGDNAFTRYAVTQNYMTDVDISPKLAYAVNEKLQVGGGVNLNFLLTNEIDWAYPVGPTSYAILRSPTSSFGLGYNLGLTYMYNKTNFVGATYYSRIRQNTTGVSTLGLNSNPNLRFGFFLPATTVLNYLHIFNKKWLINFQWFISQWNANKQVLIFNTAVPPPNQNFVFDVFFNQSNAVQIALRRQCNKKLGLTLIGLVDDGPEQDRLRTIVFPSEVQWLGGVALDYHFNDHSLVELMYGHVYSYPMIHNRVNVGGASLPFTTGSVNINVEVVDLRFKVEF